MIEFLLAAVAVLAIVFVAEAIYALFFRDFGLVIFRIGFDVPGVDPRTVWTTYFDERNDWNSVTERLSYEIVSEAPRIVRVRARRRGMNVAPVTTELKLDVTTPERSCRNTAISVDGVPLPEAQRHYETFDVAPSKNGAHVEVEAAIPVRGWLWVPVHRRYLWRIYQDLCGACWTKAGVPFREIRRGWRFWG
jgi:hypothetical protein